MLAKSLLVLALAAFIAAAAKLTFLELDFVALGLAFFAASELSHFFDWPMAKPKV